MMRTYTISLSPQAAADTLNATLSFTPTLQARDDARLTLTPQQASVLSRVMKSVHALVVGEVVSPPRATEGTTTSKD